MDSMLQTEVPTEDIFEIFSSIRDHHQPVLISRLDTNQQYGIIIEHIDYEKNQLIITAIDHSVQDLMANLPVEIIAKCEYISKCLLFKTTLQQDAQSGHVVLSIPQEFEFVQRRRAPRFTVNDASISLDIQESHEGQLVNAAILGIKAVMDGDLRRSINAEDVIDCSINIAGMIAPQQCQLVVKRIHFNKETQQTEVGGELK